jgi:hypothetical protein
MSSVVGDADANPLRGEAAIEIDGTNRLLRPSFAALVAAEQELGSLFSLVERASAGQLKLTELAALFWHCLACREGLTREQLGSAIVACGLAEASQPLRQILSQILQGDAGSPAP